MICFQAYKKSPGFNFSFLLVKKCPRRNGSQASLLPTIRAKIISKNHHVVHFRGLLHDIPLTKKHLMNHQLRDTLKLPTGKKKKKHPLALWEVGRFDDPTRGEEFLHLSSRPKCDAYSPESGFFVHTEKWLWSQSALFWGGNNWYLISSCCGFFLDAMYSTVLQVSPSSVFRPFM